MLEIKEGSIRFPPFLFSGLQDCKTAGPLSLSMPAGLFQP